MPMSWVLQEEILPEYDLFEEEPTWPKIVLSQLSCSQRPQTDANREGFALFVAVKPVHERKKVVPSKASTPESGDDFEHSNNVVVFNHTDDDDCSISSSDVEYSIPPATVDDSRFVVTLNTPTLEYNLQVTGTLNTRQQNRLLRTSWEQIRHLQS